MMMQMMEEDGIDGWISERGNGQDFILSTCKYHNPSSFLAMMFPKTYNYQSRSCSLPVGISIEVARTAVLSSRNRLFVIAPTMVL